MDSSGIGVFRYIFVMIYLACAVSRAGARMAAGNISSRNGGSSVAELSRTRARLRMMLCRGSVDPFISSKLLDGIMVGENSDASEEVIKAVAAVMFIAGADTTTGTLLAFFWAMVLRLEAHKHAQEELDTVVGPERLIRRHDHRRGSTMAPRRPARHPSQLHKRVQIPRMADPEGCHRVGKHLQHFRRSILHDPEIYPNPDAFIPQRFLKDGKIYPDVFDLASIAFSSERRYRGYCRLQAEPQANSGTCLECVLEGPFFINIASMLHVFDIRPALIERRLPIPVEHKVTMGLVPCATIKGHRTDVHDGGKHWYKPTYSGEIPFNMRNPQREALAEHAWHALLHARARSDQSSHPLYMKATHRILAYCPHTTPRPLATTTYVIIMVSLTIDRLKVRLYVSTDIRSIRQDPHLALLHHTQVSVVVMSGIEPVTQNNPDRGNQLLRNHFGNAFPARIGIPSKRVNAQYLYRNKLFTSNEKRTAFANVATSVKRYCDELVNGWSAEVDTYLLFAGLFSAIITAFNVESYQMLLPPSPDRTPSILQQISLQLSSMMYTPPFINSSYTAFDALASATNPPPVPTWAIQLNGLWFSSLILSLSSACDGIVIKQEINNFKRGLYEDTAHIAQLRQRRLITLDRLRIDSFVRLMPILLEISFILFFSGLLLLLWSLRHTAAAMTSLFALVFILVYLALYFFAKPAECSRDGSSTQDRAETSETNQRSKMEKLLHSTAEDYREISQGLRLEADMFVTAYKDTLNNDVVSFAAMRMPDWDDYLALSCFLHLRKTDKVATRDVACSGSRYHQFEDHTSHLGAIFYCNALLLIHICPHKSQSGKIFTEHPSETTEFVSEVIEQLGICIAQIATNGRREAPEDVARTGVRPEQINWVLTTAYLLCGAKTQSDCEDNLWRPCLDLVACIIDSGDIPGKLFSSTSHSAAALAFDILQSSGYSPNKPFDNLAIFLHADALLFCAFVLGGSSESPQDDAEARKISHGLEEDVRFALLDLSTVLQRLAGHIEQDQETIPEKDKPLISHSLFHIFHILSTYLDAFQRLLPPGFYDISSAFFDAFTRRRVMENVDHNGSDDIPWLTEMWTPSDFFTAARSELTKRLLEQTDSDDDVSMHRTRDSQDIDGSHALKATEEAEANRLAADSAGEIQSSPTS
ncbi:hypothetical protein ONZ51_g11144 [Trametes cubensis]|uniref:DUF6535 domain-containing protein n=1 Tax=Trametes cubensis TaxID=1111947 RepID=A0AAD7X4A3_9APHY|nr:hypothetical protein ONZ51_g11144 [Trametes cubensis]